MPTIAALKPLDDGTLAVVVDPATLSDEGSITLWTEEEKEHALRAARLEALEEAAKIAEDFDGSRYDDLFGDEGANAAASDIAEAIRELAAQSDSKATDDPSDTA